MNYVKCKPWTQLTGGHLDDVLRLAGSSLQPDVGHLVAHQQHQTSASHASVSHASVTYQEHVT